MGGRRLSCTDRHKSARIGGREEGAIEGRVRGGAGATGQGIGKNEQGERDSAEREGRGWAELTAVRGRWKSGHRNVMMTGAL